MVKHLLPVACLVMLSGCNPFEKMGQSAEKYTDKKSVKTQGDDYDETGSPVPEPESGSDSDSDQE